MGRVRAVLLDALGTLLRLEPPAPILREQLAARGVAVDAGTAERAIAAEISYYRAHILEGADRERLEDLRARCAAVLGEALGPAGAELSPDDLRDALLASLRFTAFPDAGPALRRMRDGGLRLVVASNWDVSLHDRLAETGLSELVDGAVASAEVGVAKPSPAVFARALEIAGVRAAEALHVGDSFAEDVEGARAAGIRPVLVVRDGPIPAGDGVRVVRSLAEVA